MSADGLILTNNHVIAGAESIRVQFDDGTATAATIVGADSVDDLAVIKAEGVTKLIPASLRSAPVRVGEPVLAVGSPFGLTGTVSAGLVSAIHRPVWTSTPKGPEQVHDTIIDTLQSDAPMNPGNSGGPLVDMSGLVIGLNSAIASLPSTSNPSFAPVGIGFAIPIDQAARIAREIIATGHASRADLGVQVAGGASANPLTAVPSITQVVSGGSAERAGLHAGDTITSFDGRPTATAAKLLAALHSTPPNSTIQISYLPGTTTETISVTLGSVAVG
jgi:putative serine protease PepD